MAWENGEWLEYDRRQHKIEEINEIISLIDAEYNSIRKRMMLRNYLTIGKITRRQLYGHFVAMLGTSISRLNQRNQPTNKN
ncbi:hypothetical protein [Bacillus sp. SM2101]|uniref:hypothetical protein n=1 Tax=Bacillus sp. SM2101 TaxID=2805366 RepID=UPI001BDEA8BA|nr:hypothetical protein [Bacillus sp. SM2101]